MGKYLAIYCFFLFNYSFGQIVIEGIVKDKRRRALFGVNIFEKNTKNGVISDKNGKFQLKCTTEYPIIIISFIGYNTVEIPIEKSEEINITLKATKDVIACPAINYKYIRLGLSSGLNNTPFGIQAKGWLPSIFWSNPIMSTHIIWRTNNKKNNYLKIEGDKNIYSVGGFTLGLYGQMKRIKRNHICFNEYVLSSKILIKNHDFRIGYAKQEVIEENLVLIRKGLYLGIHKDISERLSFHVSSKIIDDHFQPAINLNYYINKFNFSVGYENNKELEVFDVSLTYLIDFEIKK